MTSVKRDCQACQDWSREIDALKALDASLGLEIDIL